mmetsp:Transcript_165365/g.530718  ORF Transcript_165365/g.530718 Transcript_165365/m.530718 type:complete len:254 (+) Transcript_165365:606-1367(+)
MPRCWATVPGCPSSSAAFPSCRAGTVPPPPAARAASAAPWPAAPRRGLEHCMHRGSGPRRRLQRHIQVAPRPSSSAEVASDPETPALPPPARLADVWPPRQPSPLLDSLPASGCRRPPLACMCHLQKHRHHCAVSRLAPTLSFSAGAACGRAAPLPPPPATPGSVPPPRSAGPRPPRPGRRGCPRRAGAALGCPGESPPSRRPRPCPATSRSPRAPTLAFSAANSSGPSATAPPPREEPAGADPHPPSSNPSS